MLRSANRASSSCIRSSSFAQHSMPTVLKQVPSAIVLSSQKRQDRSTLLPLTSVVLPLLLLSPFLTFSIVPRSSAVRLDRDRLCSLPPSCCLSPCSVNRARSPPSRASLVWCPARLNGTRTCVALYSAPTHLPGEQSRDGAVRGRSAARQLLPWSATWMISVQVAGIP
eukprot:6213271-Pleurochrysis_carterae.AAC.2